MSFKEQKWVYQRIINPGGSTRYKAKLVIKGYEQKGGIDYDKTYVQASKKPISIATIFKWHL
jgi:hypothetical protein